MSKNPCLFGGHRFFASLVSFGVGQTVQIVLRIRFNRSGLFAITYSNARERGKEFGNRFGRHQSHTCIRHGLPLRFVSQKEIYAHESRVMTGTASNTSFRYLFDISIDLMCNNPHSLKYGTSDIVCDVRRNR